MDNVNDGIMVPNVRAVFPDGSIEVMPTATAVRKAQAMGLDLVLIGPTVMPPVAKAMRYEQWLRENKRKQRDD
jgi:translation initiation factor IF-3